jgi:zinc/manganese transport system substrate-binding protein
VALRTPPTLLLALLAVLPSLAAAGCGPVGASDGRISAVGAENQYADVISQIGGPYVSVTAVMSNPNTDPHSFESSPRIASRVSSAQLVVENGLGYDSWITKILSAGGSHPKVVDAQHLLGLPDSTPNPHLWYEPTTMPVVAAAIGRDLGALQPAHAAYFAQRVRAFDASLGTWRSAITALMAAAPGAPVAVTEPVGDYLLQAAGVRVLTPFSLQAAIMNGTDPSPQDVATERALLDQHRVRALVYNRQVTDTFTQSLLGEAARAHVPVVGVYETMPTPGYDYQSWMTAETDAVAAAEERGVSAPRL